jgi:hypothetical protein
MWIMLMHRIASASVIGQRDAVASRRMAGRRFGRALSCAQASMLASAAGSGSLGWKESFGKAAADLQHEALHRQHLAQYREDRLAVALRRRSMLAGIVLGHRLLPSRSAVDAL